MMTRQSSPWLPWKLCLPHQCCLDKSFDLLFGIARVCVSACVFVCLRFEWPGNVMQHHPENWGVSETVCVCVHACQMSHTHTSGSIICSLQFETSEQHVCVCVCVCVYQMSRRRQAALSTQWSWSGTEALWVSPSQAPRSLLTPSLYPASPREAWPRGTCSLAHMLTHTHTLRWTRIIVPEESRLSVWVLEQRRESEQLESSGWLSHISHILIFCSGFQDINCAQKSTGL